MRVNYDQVECNVILRFKLKTIFFFFLYRDKKLCNIIMRIKPPLNGNVSPSLASINEFSCNVGVFFTLPRGKLGERKREICAPVGSGCRICRRAA